MSLHLTANALPPWVPFLLPSQHIFLLTLLLEVVFTITATEPVIAAAASSPTASTTPYLEPWL
jgi:hypothetical protein